jgi:hypothetical protein
MFLMRAGVDLLPALAGNSAVVLHRDGSWIPAPPTPSPTGTVRWVTRPGESGWQPADPVRVQREAARLLRWNDQQPRQVWRLNSATTEAATE